ncbi:MAG: MBL fold metallo-hydrolase [Anaerolineales bacterium]|jgi:glyoxylase-like metal-dependent hydrolase (beta-lactamase superfamily II)|nr:MBL fold metallo-hydrolase [Anaerolineales bacterium]
MAKTTIQPLDLDFQGQATAIAAYAIPHAEGVALIESGPGSTLPALERALAALGYGFEHVTHVFLTHIHLDHGGAAGFLAGRGAQIFVHANGAPHLLNPEKLIASATRIYGDKMQSLWGDFLPVNPEKLTILEDGSQVALGGALKVTAFDTPGHADHHLSYFVDGYCFTGDVGGIRISTYPYLRLPFVPPELHLEKWHASIDKLQSLGARHVVPTHFGIFDDPEWHFDAIHRVLDDVEAWLTRVMPADPPLEELRLKFVEWMEEQGRAIGLPAEVREAYLLANPLGMSADGLQRYWRKFRL